jgi:hypothetical protein
MKTPEQVQKVLDISNSPDENQIPSQYIDLPSDVVAVLWTKPSQSDADHQQTAENREILLSALKSKEEKREEIKENNFSARYNNLSADQKNNYLSAQKKTSQILMEYLQEEREITDLAMEEYFVLSKAKTMHQRFIAEKSNQPFTFNFTQEIDYRIFHNLQQRLTFKIMEKKQHLVNQEKANEIRANLGIPTQDLNIE